MLIGRRRYGSGRGRHRKIHGAIILIVGPRCGIYSPCNTTSEYAAKSIGDCRAGNT